MTKKRTRSYHFPNGKDFISNGDNTFSRNTTQTRPLSRETPIQQEHHQPETPANTQISTIRTAKICA